MSRSSHTTVKKGAGLARGPALIIGTILTAAGLILFLSNGDTGTSGFPGGDAAEGTTLLGFATNGWTAWFTTAAGALLLFGSAQHLLAKTMSLVVGLALVACAVIGFIDGDDVLGLAATNLATDVAWLVAGVLLLVNLFMPRIKHEREELADHDGRSRSTSADTDHDADGSGRRGRFVPGKRTADTSDDAGREAAGTGAGARRL